MQNFHDIIIRLNRSYRKITGPSFSKIGLSKGQPKVLDYLIQNNGCIQKEIADHCYIDPATVTNLLAIMEKRGLITRQQNEQNRRILNVYLTEEGIQHQTQVQKVFNSLDNVCFENFTQAEIAEAKRLLAKIQDNLDREEYRRG